MKRMFAVWVSAMVLVAASLPAALLGQGGCGGACLPCQGAPSPNWHYGGLHGEGYLAYCTPNQSCSACNITFRMTEREISSVELASQLRRSEGEMFKSLVSANQTKLRILPGRSAAVSLGGCDKNTPDGLVYLSPMKIKILSEMGVQPLRNEGPTRSRDRRG